MPWFDTHAHLDSEEFHESLPEVIERAKSAGVTRILCVGTTAASSQRCVEIAQQYEGVFAAVGIQPNYVGQANAGDWDAIIRLARSPKVVALGETGLDRYWHDTPFEQQQDYFDRHLALSQQTGLPFIVHMRDCGLDVAETLRAARNRGELRGVMHSFTGDAALATECVELGLYVSFAGMVTYKKSEELQAVAREVPADRLLVETDSPYLSPHPHRGVRPNEPARVVHTGACLAETRGISVEECAALTTANACRLFRVD
jgi:TatD DNase family protein